MPTYVYECRTCAKVFEVEQRIVEDALTDCDCGAKGSLRRIIQPIAVLFKGSGFYVNDAQKSSNPVGAPAESAPETKATESSPATSPAPVAAPEASNTSAPTATPTGDSTSPKP